MKKFRPNKMTTFLFAMLEMMPAIGIGIPVMGFFMGEEYRFSAREIFGLIPTFFLLYVLIIVFCCVLNLVTYPFTKHTVFLFDDSFSRGETTVRYDDVTKIEFDSGMIRRFGSNDPCCIDCYSEDKLLVCIEHPSLLMCFFLFRKCKNAKFRYKRGKQFLFLLGFFLFLCVAFGLFGRTQ